MLGQPGSVCADIFLCPRPGRASHGRCCACTQQRRAVGGRAGRVFNLDAVNAIIQRSSGFNQNPDDAFLVNASHLFATQPRFVPDPASLASAAYTPRPSTAAWKAAAAWFIPQISWMPDHQLQLAA